MGIAAGSPPRSIWEQGAEEDEEPEDITTICSVAPTMAGVTIPTLAGGDRSLDWQGWPTSAGVLAEARSPAKLAVLINSTIASSSKSVVTTLCKAISSLLQVFNGRTVCFDCT